MAMAHISRWSGSPSGLYFGHQIARISKTDQPFRFNSCDSHHRTTNCRFLTLPTNKTLIFRFYLESRRRRRNLAKVLATGKCRGTSSFRGDSSGRVIGVVTAKCLMKCEYCVLWLRSSWLFRLLSFFTPGLTGYAWAGVGGGWFSEGEANCTADTNRESFFPSSSLLCDLMIFEAANENVTHTHSDCYCC